MGKMWLNRSKNTHEKNHTTSKCWTFATTFSHHLLFLSPAEVAHQFQYAVRVIGSNYAPTIERDEFLVSEKIKKECKCFLDKYSPHWQDTCYLGYWAGPSLAYSIFFYLVSVAFLPIHQANLPRLCCRQLVLYMSSMCPLYFLMLEPLHKKSQKSLLHRK